MDARLCEMPRGSRGGAETRRTRAQGTHEDCHLSRTEAAESPPTSLHGAEGAVQSPSGGTILGHDDTIVAWQATEIPRYGCLGNRHGMTVGWGCLGNRHGMTVGCRRSTSDVTLSTL